MMKKLYLQKNTGRNSLKTILVHETKSYMCAAATSITLLWTASCVHVSGLTTRTEMEAVPCILPVLNLSAPFSSE